MAENQINEIKNTLTFFKEGKIDYNITTELAERKNKSLNNLITNPKKPVYMYDKQMNFIGLYNSGQDIVNIMPELDLTIKGIQKVCSKYQKSHRGYIFSYTPLHEESQNQGSLLLCSNE